MIFVKLGQEFSPGKYTIELIHYCPFDEEHGLGKTEEELRTMGELVKEIPEPEIIEGKVSTLIFDKTTGQFYYEYSDAPPKPKTEIEVLQEENTELKSRLEYVEEALLNVMFGAE